MTWFDWLLVAYFAIHTVVTICLVGEPRKPILPGTAALVALGNGGLVFALVLTRGGL